MRVSVCVGVMMLFAGCGCGRSPAAWRVRGDMGDPGFPRGRIHFVEHGRRADGVLVTVTRGGETPFRVFWKYQLVPATAGVLEGPVWTGKKATGERAVAIWDLPAYRDAELCIEYADLPRFRYAERAVWILGTDPFIVGLAPGPPRRTWQEYAVLATGAGATDPLRPPHSFMTRYVLDEELDQPLDRLIVFPADFWPKHNATSVAYVRLTGIELPKPLTIDDALDALAAGEFLRSLSDPKEGPTSTSATPPPAPSTARRS